MKDYYNAKNVQQITGTSQSKAYEIIRTLRENFEKEYPNAITIQGKIPVWYFEKRLLNKGVSDELSNTNN